MGFCPSGVLSQWGFVPVGFCPVEFCPSGVLSQWGFVLHSSQVKGSLKSNIESCVSGENENFSKVTVVFFKNMRPTIKICVFQVK